MNLIRKTNEAEMILEFLKGELNLKRFNEDLNNAINELGLDLNIILNGNINDDQENIDKKVWKTKEVEGKMLSTPNLRTKAGKEMEEFLKSFKRTTCWDVDRLLNIEKKSVYGDFYPANLFKHKDVIYILIDSQYRAVFEQENADAKEITYGEMEKAIDEYNKKL